jgi:hypothetical protein
MLHLQLHHVTCYYEYDFTCGALLQRYFAAAATFNGQAHQKSLRR